MNQLANLQLEEAVLEGIAEQHLGVALVSQANAVVDGRLKHTVHEQVLWAGAEGIKLGQDFLHDRVERSQRHT